MAVYKETDTNTWRVIYRYTDWKGERKQSSILFTHLVEQERIKEIYTNEELEILLKRPETNSFAEYRSWTIVNLLLATGIRAKELRTLLIRDVCIPA